MTNKVTNRQIVQFLAENDASFDEAAAHFRTTRSFVNHRMIYMYYKLGVTCLASAVWQIFIEGRECDFEHKGFSRRIKEEDRKRKRKKELNPRPSSRSSRSAGGR